MAIVKNIGKNTLGDNNKMSVRLHEYEMSTHDLSFVWRNTQSPGTLVPFMKLVAQKGDVWDINLFNKTLTHPTWGPMLGSYKLQHWVFTCPIRLYNSWLHNNRNAIGMNMAQIKMPIATPFVYNESINYTEKGLVTNPSSLLAYLGFRGKRGNGTQSQQIQINAVPYLAYWDIFKNYFANKQEANAYYVSGASGQRIIEIQSGNEAEIYINQKGNWQFGYENDFEVQNATNTISNTWNIFWTNLKINYRLPNGNTNSIYASQIVSNTTGNFTSINQSKWEQVIGVTYNEVTITSLTIDEDTANQIWGTTKLSAFPLENLDLIRDKILETKGNIAFNINESGLSPFSNINALETISGKVYSAKRLPQYQLAVKTYDSDIFQNWVKTEWIDGTNGINEITAVDVSDGKLNLDSLNLAQKVYNMLNRIAVSGGTYRDWLETTFTAGNYLERPETPVFEGGMTQYIEFEEVISQSATEDEPLGSLAGRGKTNRQIGSGKIHIKIQEPSYIIGICAITPMIDYSQGNEWDIMAIKTMDDWHKPALDGIGFEDSINERRAYWSGYVKQNGQIVNTSIGKTVAWINYMTNYNKTFGNFAAGESESYMCLNRNYEKNSNGTEIEDLTSYIDPSKHNEIFADTDVNAMNFWLQTACDIKVRRNISAKQIPNL